MKPGQDVKGKQAHISQPSGLAVNTQCVCVCVCVTHQPAEWSRGEHSVCVCVCVCICVGFFCGQGP